MRVYILGAGTPTPTPERFGSSYVVNVAGEYLMFDCGPAATHKLVKAGLWPTQIDYLFFTHHHFDHDVDYPCFLLCRWDQAAGKANELQVFGPPPTTEFTRRILDEEVGAFAHDWIARVNAPTSQQVYVNRGGVLPRLPPTSPRMTSGRAWSTSGRLEGDGRARHPRPAVARLAGVPPGQPRGQRRLHRRHPTLRHGDRAGEGRRRDALHVLGRPVDHERERRERRAVRHDGRRRDGAGGRVKKLVLSHMGPHLSQHGPLEKGIGDVRGIFKGEIVFAEELMSFEV